MRLSGPVYAEKDGGRKRSNEVTKYRSDEGPVAGCSLDKEECGFWGTVGGAKVGEGGPPSALAEKKRGSS